MGFSNRLKLWNNIDYFLLLIIKQSRRCKYWFPLTEKLLFCNFSSFYFPRLFEEPETRAQSMLIKVSPLNRQKNSPGGHTYLSAVSSICQWYNCSNTFQLFKFSQWEYLVGPITPITPKPTGKNTKSRCFFVFVSTSKEWNWLWSELGADSGEQELTGGDSSSSPVRQVITWPEYWQKIILHWNSIIFQLHQRGSCLKRVEFCSKCCIKILLFCH